MVITADRKHRACTYGTEVCTPRPAPAGAARDARDLSVITPDAFAFLSCEGVPAPPPKALILTSTP